MDKNLRLRYINSILYITLSNDIRLNNVIINRINNSDILFINISHYNIMEYESCILGGEYDLKE